jgi:hypothetical protein
MSNPEIPPGILAKHPELEAVGEALAQRRRGEVVSARCCYCGELLSVVDVVEAGATVVSCPNGDTMFRARRKF